MPLGTAVGWRDLPIITKAGAFGTARTLVLCRAALRRLLRGDLPTSSYTTPIKNYSLPTIGITMGDAAGIGPEIIMKSLDHAALYERCRPLVIGDAARLREAGRIVRAQSEVSAIDDPADASFTPGTVDCIDLRLIPADLPWGKLSAVCGDAAYQYLARAVELAKAGKIDAICTAPLNKEALQAGGHIFPGHTEMLAHLTDTPEVSMMLSTPKLKVIHVTTHIGFIDAVAKIEPGSRRADDLPCATPSVRPFGTQSVDLQKHASGLPGT